MPVRGPTDKLRCDPDLTALAGGIPFRSTRSSCNGVPYRNPGQNSPLPNHETARLLRNG